MKTVRLDNEKEIRSMWKLLDENDSRTIIYSDTEDVKLYAWAAMEQDKSCGMAVCLMNLHTSSCSLTNVKLAAGYRRRSVLRFILSGMLEDLTDEFRRTRLTVTEYPRDFSTTLLPGLLKECSGCYPEKTFYITEFQMDIHTFMECWKGRWDWKKFIETSGYQIVPWKDLDETYYQKLRKEEEEQKNNDSYVASGICEKWKYDRDTSFALVRRSDGRLCGWIITQRWSERHMEIRRFYIYSEFRKQNLGPSFLACVLDEIDRHYRWLYFSIVHGNRQMEKVAEHFAKKFIVNRRIRCTTDVKLKSEKRMADD